jgi:hypothetical protein
MAEGGDVCADRHWISQHILLEGEYDFIGRYENLEQDLGVLKERLGLPEFSLAQKGFISPSRDYIIS